MYIYVYVIRRLRFIEERWLGAVFPKQFDANGCLPPAEHAQVPRSPIFHGFKTQIGGEFNFPGIKDNLGGEHLFPGIQGSIVGEYHFLQMKTTTSAANTITLGFKQNSAANTISLGFKKEIGGENHFLRKNTSAAKTIFQG